ncbi:MAG TPA: AAA family ATPase [Candidatus Limnocylindrales bacterium]|nr:AAA family ATPase [Candidatus Limnocylindrales bacterium]
MKKHKKSELLLKEAHPEVQADAYRESLEEYHTKIQDLKEEIQRVIVGQNQMIDSLLIGLLANGHILLEGVPGLAKTLTIKTFAKAMSASFQRIQFTPDLLPADVIGTLIYNPKDAEFVPKLGPIFAHFVLADEINRAPAKVQSALLEAMQERQVTIGKETHLLPEPFLVLATQNPIEQEGTYNLPEAQVDRFMLKVKVGYPDLQEEKEIIHRDFDTIKINPVLAPEEVTEIRHLIHKTIYMDEKIEDYLLLIIFATRKNKEILQKFGLEALAPYIRYGSSPRGSQALKTAALVQAYLQGRWYVIPEDIEAVVLSVLRHRVILSPKAEAEEKTADEILEQVLEKIPVP